MSASGEDDNIQKKQFSTLSAEGKWMFGQKEHENAINSLTAALALSPGDKNGLVCRAECYMKLGMFEEALKDAEASLKDDETFSEGLYLKAEALFHMGEYEFALVFYRRGLDIRRPKFRLGMQKSQRAILDSIGGPSTVELNTEGDLSFLQKEVVGEQPIDAIQNRIKEKRHDSPKSDKSKKTTK